MLMNLSWINSQIQLSSLEYFRLMSLKTRKIVISLTFKFLSPTRMINASSFKFVNYSSKSPPLSVVLGEVKALSTRSQIILMMCHEFLSRKNVVIKSEITVNTQLDMSVFCVCCFCKLQHRFLLFSRFFVLCSISQSYLSFIRK